MEIEENAADAGIGYEGLVVGNAADAGNGLCRINWKYVPQMLEGAGLGCLSVCVGDWMEMPQMVEMV